MNILNLVSDEEKNMINDYRRYYAYNSDTNLEPEADVDTILRFWGKNKSKYLFDLLGQQFTYSQKIEYHRPLAEIRSQISDELNIRIDSPLKIFKEYYEKALKCLENEFGFLPQEYWVSLHLLEPYVLAENKADINFDMVLNGKKISIQTESKPVKIIRKIVLALELNEQLFEDFRIALSLILNQKTLKGDLCISIHPLDYMTMSDNSCDWSSCMSWKESGCYRRGTVEMMNSVSVVVAYLKSDHEFFLDSDHTWSNKKWRQLFIVDENFIAGIKGYPYKNIELQKEVIKILAKLAKENLGWEYYDQFCIYNDAAEPLSISTKTNELCFDFMFETNDMYNDFGSTDSVIMVSTNYTDNATICYNYSGPSVCMCCGKAAAYYDDCEAECLVCCDCLDVEPEPECYCDNCGDPIWNSHEAIDLSGGHIICRCCYEDEQIFTDDINNLTYPFEEELKLYLIDENLKPLKNYFPLKLHRGIWYTSMWNTYFQARTPNWRYIDNIGWGYTVKESECTKSGLKLFKSKFENS